MPKTNQMATKKPVVKETARLTIICDSDNECTVKVKGDRLQIIQAFSILLETEHDENEFREMMAFAMKIVLEEDKNKKRVTKKKAAPKKKK
jgi:hypothetical protein